MLRWTKRKLHLSPRFTKLDQEAIVEVDRKIFSPTIGALAEIETELEGIITIEIIDPTLEIDPVTIICVTTEEITTSPMRDIITTDRTIGREITIDKTIRVDKIIERMTLDKETGVTVEIDQEIIIITVPKVETEVEIEIEIDRCNLDPELCQMTEDQGLDLNCRVNTNRDRLRC